MRIIHVKSAGGLSADARRRLAEILQSEPNAAVRALQTYFPRHRVFMHRGHIQVARQDGKIFLDAFGDGARETRWIETTAGLRMTTPVT